MGDIRAALPFTGAGIVVAALGALGYVVGWRLGWIELMALAAACILALVIALPFVVGRTHLDMTRSIDPVRVTVGDHAGAVLRVENSGRTASAPRLIEDKVGQTRRIIELAAMAAGGVTESIYTLPTARRGRFDVGPAVIVKADPLGLMRREIAQTGKDVLWVHPRTALLDPLPVGFAKDLEGPTSDTSPAGDVAFHALREYAFGDDHRHIHWMSSARTGTLMVRHYVDNRRPQLAVVVDGDRERFVGDGFEIAIEIAASLAISANLHEQPLSLRIGPKPVVGSGRAGTTDDTLDRLATAELPSRPSDLATDALIALRADTGSSAVVMITGPRAPEDLMPLVQATRRLARPIIIRIWPDGDIKPSALPGAKLLDVASLDHFAMAWKRAVR